MELKITEFFNQAEHVNYSASRAEIGENAGHITWSNAQADSVAMWHFVSADNRSEIVDYFASFGAWEHEDLETWNDIDLNALLIQFMAGDIRGARAVASFNDGSMNWPVYEELQKVGTVSGRLFRGVDGEIYFYVGE